MEKAARTRLVVLAVLLAVAGPLLIMALAGSGDDDGDERPAGLRVERSPGGLPEITVYLEDRSLNKRSTTGGAAQVVAESPAPTHRSRAACSSATDRSLSRVEDAKSS